MSEREKLQDHLEQYLKGLGLDQVYGVLTGMETTPKGQKVRTLTFCRARTLDGTVKIFSPTFFTVNTSRVRQTQVFRSLEELEEYLATL